MRQAWDCITANFVTRYCERLNQTNAPYSICNLIIPLYSIRSREGSEPHQVVLRKLRISSGLIQFAITLFTWLFHFKLFWNNTPKNRTQGIDYRVLYTDRPKAIPMITSFAENTQLWFIRSEFQAQKTESIRRPIARLFQPWQCCDAIIMRDI